MTSQPSPRPLKIKKYSNRRFYDTTRSCHVTLREMHDLVCEGYDLRITDSKSGADITNLVLTQIILERDPPKLDVFPADVLHQLIRTQQQFLGGVVEQFFAQVLKAHQASREQWSRFLRNTLGFGAMPAGDLTHWTRAFMESLMPRPASRAEAEPDERDGHDQEVERLRDQVAELSRQVERMARDRESG